MAAIVKADAIENASENKRLLFENMQSGMPLSINVIRNNQRTSLGGSPRQTLFTGNFFKHLETTILIATCTVFGASYASGNCGVGLVLDGNLWDYGCGYQYDGLWGASQTTVVTGTGRWTGISAGKHTMGFGWNTINASAGEKPFNNFNPNYSDDSRNYQMSSSIIVYEVFP